ncbi:MAG: hypothetical protein ACLFQU_02190 [Candidatus Kapaibacterium sp.]
MGIRSFDGCTKTQIEEIILSCLKIASNTTEFSCLAEVIFDELNDPKLAAAILEHAEQIIDDPEGYLQIIDIVRRKSDDETWLINLYIKAFSELNDPLLIALLVTSVYKTFKDAKWAEKAIFDCLDEFQNIAGYRYLMLEAFDAINDKTFIHKVITDASKYAVSSLDFIDLSYRAGKYLEDKNLEFKYLEMAIIQAQSTCDYCDIASSNWIHSYPEYYKDCLFEAFRLHSSKQELAGIIVTIALSFNEFFEASVWHYVDDDKIELELFFKNKLWAMDLFDMADQIKPENISNDLKKLLAFCIYKYHDGDWCNFKKSALEYPDKQ